MIAVETMHALSGMCGKQYVDWKCHDVASTAMIDLTMNICEDIRT